MRVLSGRVVWLYGSEGLHKMRVMRGWEGEGCLMHEMRILSGRVVWLYGSEGLHEMRVLRGRVVWLYGSEGIT